MPINQIGSSYPFVTADYTDNSVTYAKIQQASAETLLGNPTGVLGDVQEIPLGTNLSFSGGVLNASGGSGGISLGLTTIISKGLF